MSRIGSQIFITSLLALMGVALWFLWDDAAREGKLALIAGAIIGLSIGMERFVPFLPQWNTGEKAETLGDIGNFALVFLALDGLLKWLFPFLILALLPSQWKSESLALPLWMQAGAVTLWIEFAAWFSHYWHHRLPWLWSLHAMHHSSERLYTFNNFRLHPLNHVINHMGMMLPPMLLGISPDAVLIYSTLALPLLLLQHSNIAFDFGVLSYVFNTNEMHRWHHSAAPEEGMKNLGRALVIWDIAFGTFLYRAGQRPAKVGLFASSHNYPAPGRFLAQIVWPFSRNCCN